MPVFSPPVAAESAVQQVFYKVYAKCINKYHDVGISTKLLFRVKQKQARYHPRLVGSSKLKSES